MGVENRGGGGGGPGRCDLSDLSAGLDIWFISIKGSRARGCMDSNGAHFENN